VSSQVRDLAEPRLNVRQQQTVERLLEAGATELRAVGVDGLTIRTVALRAGVSSATAYTYFTSKDHLFAELYWRHLRSHPAPASEPYAGVVARLSAATRSMATMLADSPEMAAAATRALLGNDPAVERLRLRIGTEYARRFQAALGPDHDPSVLDTLSLTFLGALLHAGMGFFTYTQMADRLDAAIAVIMKGQA
jgi:AcrR family transcriptional regulator